jgi:serine/threonine protein kinase
MTMSILELLQHIVNEPAPRLTPEGRFPPESEEFIDLCLLKDPDARATPKELLVSIIFIPLDIVLFAIFFADLKSRIMCGFRIPGRKTWTWWLGQRLFEKVGFRISVGTLFDLMG